MTKKVLALYYTQTGQLADIVDQFTAPLIEAGATVEKVNIKPVNDYPFPWKSEVFFDAMPESVKGIPVELQPFSFNEEKYDLIIFAYQPWFLSPSIPATSMLKHDKVKQTMRDTPVITLSAGRNMWINAQEKVKRLLLDAGAKLVGNVALVDRHHNLVSVITIMHWAFGGKKDKYLGVFPRPGVSDEDIQHASEFGKIALPFLQAGSYDTLQEKLAAAGAVVVKNDIMFIEERAGRLFDLWANAIYGKPGRTFKLLIYKYYLLVALFLVAPIVLTLNFLVFRWFLLSRNARQKLYYQGISLK
jgi:hypothetical protein